MLEQTRIGAKHSTVEQAEDNLKKTRFRNKIQTRWFMESTVSF